MPRSRRPSADGGSGGKVCGRPDPHPGIPEKTKAGTELPACSIPASTSSFLYAGLLFRGAEGSREEVLDGFEAVLGEVPGPGADKGLLGDDRRFSHPLVVLVLIIKGNVTAKQ